MTLSARRVIPLLLFLMPALLHAETEAPQVVGCIVKPNREVKVSSPVSGVISTLQVEKGDRVEAGQVIAQLNAELEQTRAKTAEARAKFARRKLDRYAEMIRNGLIPQEQIDELTTELDVARLELQELRTQLQLKTIRSPIDGYVKEVALFEGEYVGSGPIAEIADISSLYAQVILRESAYGRFDNGEVVTIRLLGPVQQTREATVRQVDRLIDPASGTFTLRAYIDNEDHALPAGVNCDLR